MKNSVGILVWRAILSFLKTTEHNFMKIYREFS